MPAEDDGWVVASDQLWHDQTHGPLAVWMNKHTVIIQSLLAINAAKMTLLSIFCC